MSAFSSLILFYPGKPPTLCVEELRRFCDRLRDAVATGGTGRTAQLRYGAGIDQDYESTAPAGGDGASAPGDGAEYPWDHAREGTWAELWPADPIDEARQIYRAYVGLGNLPPKVSRGLSAARGEHSPDEFFAPETLSLRINPVCPGTLDTEELTAYGLVEIAFSGESFLSWQPLERYWKGVRDTSALGRVQAVCREGLPVPPLDFLDQLKDEMGALFLNRAEYQPGDWIVSVAENV